MGLKFWKDEENCLNLELKKVAATLLQQIATWLKRQRTNFCEPVDPGQHLAVCVM